MGNSMVTYINNAKIFKTLKLGITFFNEPYSPYPGVDIIREFQYQKKKCFSEEFFTLFTDLRDDSQAIFGSISKNTRYEIKRAAGRDNIIIKTLDSKKAKQGFYDFYNRFALTKNRAPIGLAETDSLIENNLFTIRAASLDDDIIVYHTYITANNRARLAQSASLFRESDNNDYRALVGRANRLLHWEDMQYFKQNSFEIYDWGGVSMDPRDREKQDINKFKEAFGGTLVKEYKSQIPVSTKGWIYLIIKSCWNILKVISVKR
jgi:lipid II:glycine glycyltransferase (peptidoglycan interpeptide bridge formation enzyme)